MKCKWLILVKFIQNSVGENYFLVKLVLTALDSTASMGSKTLKLHKNIYYFYIKITFYWEKKRKNKS